MKNIIILFSMVLYQNVAFGQQKLDTTYIKYKKDHSIEIKGDTLKEKITIFSKSEFISYYSSLKVKMDSLNELNYYEIYRLLQLVNTWYLSKEEYRRMLSNNFGEIESIISSYNDWYFKYIYVKFGDGYLVSDGKIVGIWNSNNVYLDLFDTHVDNLLFIENSIFVYVDIDEKFNVNNFKKESNFPKHNLKEYISN